MCYGVEYLSVLGYCKREIVQRLLPQHGRKQQTTETISMARRLGGVANISDIPNACMLTETASVKRCYQLDKRVKEVALPALGPDVSSGKGLHQDVSEVACHEPPREKDVLNQAVR